MTTPTDYPRGHCTQYKLSIESSYLSSKRAPLLEDLGMDNINRPPNKLLTLLFVLKPGNVLLGYKKRGFGQGRWNGFGGKVQQNETIQEAAVRETKEECGLDVSDLDKVGTLIFEFVGEPQLLEVHVFRTEHFTGTVTESEEMRPQWFLNGEIPFNVMWPDDYLWYPMMLNKKYFNGYLKFEGMDNVLEYNFTETTPSN